MFTFWDSARVGQERSGACWWVTFPEIIPALSSCRASPLTSFVQDSVPGISGFWCLSPCERGERKAIGEPGQGVLLWFFGSVVLVYLGSVVGWGFGAVVHFVGCCMRFVVVLVSSRGRVAWVSEVGEWSVESALAFVLERWGGEAGSFENRLFSPPGCVGLSVSVVPADGFPYWV